jgi:hypothetical protein
MRGARGILAVVALAWVSGCAGKQDEPASMARAREMMRSAETARGDLLLRCEPSDAEVYLDGVVQGVCSDFGGSPMGLKVGEGLHEVRRTASGRTPPISSPAERGPR